MKREIFLFNKAEEAVRLMPCNDDNAVKRKKSRFKAWFRLDFLPWPLLSSKPAELIRGFTALFVFCKVIKKIFKGFFHHVAAVLIVKITVIRYGKKLSVFVVVLLLNSISVFI